MKRSADLIAVVTSSFLDGMVKLCNRYVILLRVLYLDDALNQWCRNYRYHNNNDPHHIIEETIYNGLMKDAYALDFASILSTRPYHRYDYGSTIHGTVDDLIYGICLEIRHDHFVDGALINDSIASGRLYHLVDALLKAVEQ